MQDSQVANRVQLRVLTAETPRQFSQVLDTFLIPLIQKADTPSGEASATILDTLRLMTRRVKDSHDTVIPVTKILDFYKKSISEIPSGGTTQLQLSHLQDFVWIIISRDPSVISADYFLNGIELIDSEIYIDSHESFSSEIGEHFSFLLYQILETGSLNLKMCTPSQLHVLQTKFLHLFLLDLKHSKPESHKLLPENEILFFTFFGKKYGLEYPLLNEYQFSKLRKTVFKLVCSDPVNFQSVILAACGDTLSDIRKEANSQVKKLQNFDPQLLMKFALFGSDELRVTSSDLLVKSSASMDLSDEFLLKMFKSLDTKLKRNALVLLERRSDGTSGTGNLSAGASNVSTDTDNISDGIGATTTSGNGGTGVVDVDWPRTLRQYIVDEGWPRAQIHSNLQSEVRMKCYELIGKFETSKSAVSFLFQSLERDLPQFVPSIQKSLSYLLNKPGTEVDMDKMLYYMLKSTNQRIKYAAVKFSVTRGDSKSAIERVICLLGLDTNSAAGPSSSSDVVVEAQRGLLTPDVTMLPSFNDVFSLVIKYFRVGFTSKQVLEPTLMFLWCCLNRIPITSTNWTSELLSSLNGSYQPQEDPTEFVNFLLSLVFDNSLEYMETVKLMLQVLLTGESRENKLACDSASQFSSEQVCSLLKGEECLYAEFVAEYCPLFVKDLQLPSENSKLLLVARVFQFILSMQHNSNELTGCDLLQLALDHNNLMALQALACVQQINQLNLKKYETKPLFLACLSVHATDNYKSEILDFLLAKKQDSFDDLLNVGEALSVVCSGWGSQILQNRYPQIKKRLHNSPSVARNEPLWIVHKILNDITSDIRGSPQSRKCASVRLLCLVQNSLPNLNENVNVATGIQQCFMSLLTDSDEVSQECAGKGLSLLFEKSEGNQKLKNDLLSTLVSSFTNTSETKKLNAVGLTHDTQIFEPGALPSSPKGDGSISTYKDVLNLANETGDTSLVYKFMALSSSSQIWSGRKGIAFSLKQILMKSELSNQIFTGSSMGRNLIPKLFRYLYDPNEQTQNAMKQIWTSFVPPNQRTFVIKLYLPLIVLELNDSAVDQEWRVRQASAMAYTDLITQSLEPSSLNLWKLGFRLVDDIKDSVRQAGAEMLRALTNTLIRQASSGSRTDLNHTIPFLLQGLNNESTRSYSLNSLIKLSETKAFKPHAVEVMIDLVLQLSSLEPQAFNYLALNTSQSLVDEARVKGLRDSPIMQTLESMIERQMPTIDEMWGLLPELVKRSVGIPSKLAASKLVSLTCSHTYGAEKHASEALVGVMTAQLWSANNAVSISYASSIGYLSRQIPLALLSDLVDNLWRKFAESESEQPQLRSIIGRTLESISSNSSDAFADIAKTTMPIVFIGQFCDKPKFFKQTWEGNTGGSGSLRLYRREILDLAINLITTSSSRSMKITAAKAIDAAQLNLDSNENIDLTSLLNVLLQQMVSRSWPGKEVLFDALVRTCISGGTGFSDDILNQVKERVLTEIKRRNREYTDKIVKSTVFFYKKFPFAELEEQLFTHIIETDSEKSTTDLCIENFESVFSVVTEPHALEILNIVDLDNWKIRLHSVIAFRNRQFNSQIWRKITDCCANDTQHELVRLEWVKTAQKFKNQNEVLDDVKRYKHSEKSFEVISQMNKVLA